MSRQQVIRGIADSKQSRKKQINMNFIVKAGVFLYNLSMVGANCIVFSAELQ